MVKEFWGKDVQQEVAELTSNKRLQIEQRKAADMVNNLESSKFSSEKLGSWKKTFDLSNELEVRSHLGNLISSKGKAGLILLPCNIFGDQEYILKSIELTNWTIVGNKTLYLSGILNNKYNHNGMLLPLFVEVKMNENNDCQVSTSVKIPAKEGETAVKETLMEYIYPNSNRVFIGHVFKNNWDLKSDIEYYVADCDIFKLEQLDKEVVAEFRRSRSSYTFNYNFTDNDGTNTVREIDSGKRMALEEQSEDGKYGVGTNIIPGTAASQILIGNVLLLEMEIYKKLGLEIDQSSSGSNQHNLQVVLANKFGSENLILQRQLRNEDWVQFFKNCSTLIPVQDLEAEDVDTGLGFVETAKHDLLRAQIEGELAKVNNNNNKPTPKEKPKQDEEDWYKEEVDNE